MEYTSKMGRDPDLDADFGFELNSGSVGYGKLCAFVSSCFEGEYVLRKPVKFVGEGEKNGWPKGTWKRRLMKET